MATLELRARLSLVLATSLLLLALQLDALPVDVDLPGVPDLEVAYPVGVLLSTLCVLSFGFLYASWLLNANAPVHLGFHKGGLVVGYRPSRSRWAKALWSMTAPRLVPWRDLRSVRDAGSIGLSRHDLKLLRRNGRAWVLVGLSPELLRAVVESFEAHLEVLRRGSFRGFVPFALPTIQGEQPATA